jgi:hypothetical protein
MGEVIEVGRGVTKLEKGDRVVVPFVIAFHWLMPRPRMRRFVTKKTPA